MMTVYISTGIFTGYISGESKVFNRNPGRGGPTQVWFGLECAAGAWKVDPFLYQILTKNEIHFYTNATNFKQMLLKISHYFPKLLSFQAILFFLKFWWNWAYFHANFRKFWNYDPYLYQFWHWIKGHRYTRRLILGPISAAPPWIDLHTNPPPPSDRKHPLI